MARVDAALYPILAAERMPVRKEQYRLQTNIPQYTETIESSPSARDMTRSNPDCDGRVMTSPAADSQTRLESNARKITLLAQLHDNWVQHSRQSVKLFAKPSKKKDKKWKCQRGGAQNIATPLYHNVVVPIDYLNVRYILRPNDHAT
jgi:hypothetical protein